MSTTILPYGRGTELLGLLGCPLGHSVTPRIHNTLYQLIGLNAVMLPMELEDAPGNLDRFFEAVRTLRIRGFIVTMPYKSRMLPYLDKTTEESRMVNCVNAVRYSEGMFSGACFDGFGMCQAIEDTGVRLEGREALILGAGGICGPVACEMSRRGVAGFTILNRTPGKAERLAEALRACTGKAVRTGPLTEEALDRAAGRAGVVAQCTSLGMYGTGSAFPYLGFLKRLDKDAAVVEAIYNPARTEFLEAAARSGLRTVNGRGMLSNQIGLLIRFFFDVELGAEGKAAAARAVESVF